MTAMEIKRSSLWFEDGSIVLQAEDTQFLVHRSVMAFHSQVFRDMFLLPQGENAKSGELEMVEGRPLVRLPDGADEVELMLSALYDQSRLSRKPLVDNFPAISAALRLGTKYLIPPIRRIAHSALAETLPMSNSPEALEHFIALSFSGGLSSPSSSFTVPVGLSTAGLSPTTAHANPASSPFPPHLLVPLANLLAQPAHALLPALPPVLYWLAVALPFSALMALHPPLSPVNLARVVTGKAALAAEHKALVARMLFYLDPLPQGCLSARAHAHTLAAAHAQAHHSPVGSHHAHTFGFGSGSGGGGAGTGTGGHVHAHSLSHAQAFSLAASPSPASLANLTLGLGISPPLSSSASPAGVHLAPHTQPACRAALVDELLAWTARQHYQLFLPWQGKMENFLRGGVCEVCLGECAERYEAGRWECWERLPGMFGLGTWEELEAAKEAQEDEAGREARAGEVNAEDEDNVGLGAW